MKTLKYLLLAISISLGFTAHADKFDDLMPSVVIQEQSDHFNAPEFIASEQAALDTLEPQKQREAPEREGPLAPLFKILKDDWIFVTDGKPSAQWASGEIAQRGAKSLVEGLDFVLDAINVYDGASASEEVRDASKKLKEAREIVKNGLAFSDAHRYSSALHAAIVNAKDLLSQIDVKSPSIAEDLYMHSYMAELHFYITLNGIGFLDLKSPEVSRDTLVQKSLKSFDHVYAAARLFKVQVRLMADLNRRAAKIIAKYASGAVRDRFVKVNLRIKAMAAQLKVKKDKLLEGLGALASQGDETARGWIAQLSGGGGTARQCRALFNE